jgi:hypothetical protein
MYILNAYPAAHGPASCRTNTWRSGPRRTTEMSERVSVILDEQCYKRFELNMLAPGHAYSEPGLASLLEFEWICHCQVSRMLQRRA